MTEYATMARSAEAPPASLPSSELARLPALLEAAVDFETRLQGWAPGAERWFGGVRGAVNALLAATLARHCGSLLVVLPATAEVDLVAADVAAFGIEDVLTLPLCAEKGTAELLRDQDFAQRLQVLQKLRRRSDRADSGPFPAERPLVVTAHISAVTQRVPSRQAIAAATRPLTVGERIDLPKMLEWLAASGFHAATAVEMPGEFSLRGGILDLFPSDQPLPLRIELFDDEVESIRRFDPASQRSTERLPRLELTAVSATQEDLGQLADYLPAETAVLIIDPQACREAAQAVRDRVADPSHFLSWPELGQSLAEHRVALASDLPEGDLEGVIDLPTAAVDSFSVSLDELKGRVDSVAAGHRVLVVADTPADAERMGDLLRETEAARRGELKLVTADLSGGFRLELSAAAESTRPETSVAKPSDVLVLTGAELFHRSPVRRARVRVKSKPLDSFLQLKAGDLVVHLSHGIGIYRGLELIDKGGQQQEHLAIEFDGGTKLYVPASRIALVQRYVGGSGSRPRLAKIGGQGWVKQKKAVRQAVTDMAAELLELQAARATRAGIAFDPDSDWQRQFDASFPYTETPDQLLSIDALKADMETARPMERLICGDVGYGKTEVAMRAAFKAVDSGYQVAVLVPTTVLAEQHFHSFTERMAEFPFDIVKLSRFATPQEQREAIQRIKAGAVDIVIGTHRLASADVHFFNLGLVVIDEEHRFGVQVKERLKNKHRNVDVLTLSATPIPRTLHMALVGVRDISNLETPPAERMAVETRVTRWDEKLIRSAIVRELNRGGQIYFVHNRVGDIQVLAEKLRRIVPEASIGIGHGQMPEGELEGVMVDFVARKFDILLATTIIESGLDIPNANTIFVDEADRYGLADLHQLRGRVGRYKHQAYCYLMVDRHKHLTPAASKRLRAIEEFSQMGAGFAIAMRDLEIRGAGNLLGTQQSGHIAAVGYELYCQLLEDAVRSVRQLPPRLSADVDLDLPVEAYLPPDYVPDLRHKIDLYRRISRIDSAEQIPELREELLDRFGPPPRPVERLMEMAELRLDAAVWQIASIATETGFLVLHYTDRGRLEQLARQAPLPVRIVDDRRAYVPVPKRGEDATGEEWLRLARSVLRLA